MPVCEVCHQECTERDRREFPGPCYICADCEQVGLNLDLRRWRRIDAAQAAIGNHLDVASASWDPSMKALEWWRSVNRKKEETKP